MEGWITRETLFERFDEVQKLFWWAFENKIRNTKRYRVFQFMGHRAKDLNSLFWIKVLKYLDRQSIRLSLSTFVVNNVIWSVGHENWKVFDEKRGITVSKCSIDTVEDIEEIRWDERDVVDWDDLYQQVSRWVDGRTWVVLKGRLLEDRSLEDVGKGLKITRQRVEQIQAKGLGKLKNSQFGKNLEKVVYFPNDCG